jgi:hypothetical protein
MGNRESHTSESLKEQADAGIVIAILRGAERDATMVTCEVSQDSCCFVGERILVLQKPAECVHAGLRVHHS